MQTGKSIRKKVITGDWDGQPIWRYQTSGEELSELIEKQNDEERSRKISSDAN